MLSVIMLNVVMLSVEAPLKGLAGTITLAYFSVEKKVLWQRQKYMLLTPSIENMNIGKFSLDSLQVRAFIKLRAPRHSV
jgi:hypothetical protein